jgi:aerobic carbon-monoxide dehydrogenase medium subunit
MYQTTYHRPSSVDEAVAMFGKGSDAKYLAGGHTLIPVMKQRLAAPSDVIDLGRIKELVGIEASGDTLTIKAATTYFDIMQSADVKKSIPAIAYLTSVLGDPAVRHRGTIGGSIANNDPAADFPAALVSLGATVKTNKRSIAADDFFKGLFTTALEDGEIITAVSFPVPAKAGYAKFRHPASRFALTGVFVTKMKSGVEGELVGVGDRCRAGFREWPDERYPRNLGLPRQPDQGDGATRGGGSGLEHQRRNALHSPLKGRVKKERVKALPSHPNPTAARCTTRRFAF